MSRSPSAERYIFFVWCFSATLIGTAAAQDALVTLRVSASATVAYTRVDPAPGGQPLAETRIEQDIVSAMARALGDHLQATGMLDLEGLTMPGGVLTLGGWGEGFIERRHPHTYAHELMLFAVFGGMGRLRGSVAVGKGFVPFGTDDPMNRPVLRFPVNHHWSQIIERALIAAGAHAGPVILEGSIFNGDEPERPGQWPLASRLGDSWSVRLSADAASGVEAQVSRAHVKSPEHRPGAGTSQEKWNISARIERPVGSASLYALGEWARTEEANGLFRFDSWLVEASFVSARGRHRAYHRFEDTDRPEEERTLSPFRSLRPHIENSILGVSRWRVHTAGYGFTVPSPVPVEPMLEISRAAVRERVGGIFDVASVFGRSTLWSVTIGVRVRSPGPAHRMGRYGVSEPAMHHH